MDHGGIEKPFLINFLATLQQDSFHCGQQKVIMHSSSFQRPPLIHGLNLGYIKAFSGYIDCTVNQLNLAVIKFGGFTILSNIRGFCFYKAV